MTSSYTTWHRLAPPLLLIYLLLPSNTLILQTTAQLTKGNRKAPQDPVTAFTPSYRPINVTCPSRSLLRNAGTVAGRDQTINPDEAAYVENRRITEVADAFENYLANVHTGYDLRKLAPNASYWPTVGIAVSGGGFRAALVGAGIFNAFDQRNKTAVKAGTGGILQLASYVTGLSGGAWFVSSLAINSHPSMHDLILGSPKHQGWFLERNLFTPDGALSILDNSEFFENIQANVELKERAGFNTSITDTWGLALSYHFGPNGTTDDNFFEKSQTLHNTPALWSEIKATKAFKKRKMPFPAIVADSRPPGYHPIDLGLSKVYIPLNSTVYEFNPYEFGSYDPSLAHFIELEYTGTNLFHGQPLHPEDCVNRFDNFAFVIGTSSSLFNAIVQTTNSTLLEASDTQGFVEEVISDLMTDTGSQLKDSEDDIAIYPNPFYGINEGIFPRADDDGLELVDGGEAGANIPLDPLLVKARRVDTILAIDASSDTDEGWPDGKSLIASYERAASLSKGHQILPFIPSRKTFIKQGINARPTFFGCNASQSEIKNQMPLIVYIPNAPSGGAFNSNTSTWDLEYTPKETIQFLDAVFNTTTNGIPLGQSGKDEEWPACLACAIVERKRQYRNMDRSDVCEQCFKRYCWNGADTFNVTKYAADNPDKVFESSAVRRRCGDISLLWIATLTVLLFWKGSIQIGPNI